jgi:hypothetical protein
MYSRVPFLGRKVRHVWRGVGSHEGFPKRHEGSPSSPSLSHEGIALSLVVDFEAASKPSQLVQEQIHSPDASGPPLPPKVCKKP